MTRREEIQVAVDDPVWQAFRISLRGMDTKDKLAMLKEYKKTHPGRKTEVQIENYINALKRGGQLK